MRISHPFIANLFSLVLAGLSLAAGVAGAQTTQTLFFSNPGSNSNAAAGAGASNGTLAQIAFDLSHWNRAGSVLADSGAVSARADVAGPGLAYDINVIAPNLSIMAPPGAVLQSVTFYLYALSVNPDGGPLGFSVYDGFQGSLGSYIGPLSLSGPADENGFISFTVSAAQLAGGISITADGLPANALLNLSSEMDLANPAFTPGVSATFAVPEPASFGLAAFTGLLLLRRKRA